MNKSKMILFLFIRLAEMLQVWSSTGMSIILLRNFSIQNNAFISSSDCLTSCKALG